MSEAINPHPHHSHHGHPHGRQKVTGVQMLCPHRFVASVTDVKPEELRAMGMDTVLLDLDNTLVGWQRKDLTDEVRHWLKAMQATGMRLYLVSNTRFSRRILELSEELGIPHVRRAAKPRRRGFLQAMKELGSDPAKTVMIGDQMFTDVLGGNRCGLYTVMVTPVAKHEFIGTKFSRAAEKWMLKWFRKKGHL